MRVQRRLLQPPAAKQEVFHDLLGHHPPVDVIPIGARLRLDLGERHRGSEIYWTSSLLGP